MVELIRDLDTLHALCGRLRAAGSFALDTEFHRERTYSSELCLVQLATSEECQLVDPLAMKDLGPLAELVADSSVEVVLHAAEQDLEIFYELYKVIPAKVYDTQVAAALAGLGEQVGYAALVQRLLRVHLDKSQTATDWSRRPLSEEQVTYALDDVRYLPLLKARLERRLARQGRQGWLEEELAGLHDPARYLREPEDLWRRIRRAGSLKGQSLAILRELATWRDARARRYDRPRSWVLKDEQLVEVARRAPTDKSQLEGIRLLDRGRAERLAGDILEAVGRGLAVPEEDWPAPLERVGREDAPRSDLLNLLDMVLRTVASQENIALRLLGTRSDVTELCNWLERNAAGDGSRRDGRKKTRPRLLEGWRGRMVGSRLLEVAEGRANLRYDPERRCVSFSNEV